MESIRKLTVSPHFQFFTYEPEGILSNHISMIWASLGVPPFKQERVVPDGANVLLFNFGEPVSIINRTSEVILKQTLFTGISSQFANLNYTAPGTKHMQVGVVFKPGGAYPFIQQPIIAFKNQAVETADMGDPYFKYVYEEIGAIDDPQKRIFRLTQLLRGRLQTQNTDHLTPQLIQLIQRSPEVSIDIIAQKSGYSQQHMNRLLGKYAGINAKGFQKIFRLHKAMKAVRNMEPDGNLTDVSYLVGYFDQAHFIHDFKEMTGMTPGDYCVIRPPAPERVLYLS